LGPAAVDSFFGINNRTIDGWASVEAYVGNARVHAFCVGPGKTIQEGVAQIVTRVSVEVSRGVDCKGKPIDVIRELPVHMMSEHRVGALGFLDGNRGSYTIKDRL
jgi:hypothetical protein